MANGISPKDFLEMSLNNVKDAALYKTKIQAVIQKISLILINDLIDDQQKINKIKILLLEYISVKSGESELSPDHLKFDDTNKDSCLDDTIVEIFISHYKKLNEVYRSADKQLGSITRILLSDINSSQKIIAIKDMVLATLIPVDQ